MRYALIEYAKYITAVVLHKSLEYRSSQSRTINHKLPFTFCVRKIYYVNVFQNMKKYYLHIFRVLHDNFENKRRYKLNGFVT